jgi:hypothetical protein
LGWNRCLLQKRRGYISSGDKGEEDYVLLSIAVWTVC